MTDSKNSPESAPSNQPTEPTPTCNADANPNTPATDRGTPTIAHLEPVVLHPIEPARTPTPTFNPNSPAATTQSDLAVPGPTEPAPTADPNPNSAAADALQPQIVEYQGKTGPPPSYEQSQGDRQAQQAQRPGAARRQQTRQQPSNARVTPLTQLGCVSQRIDCPFCKQVSTTIVEQEASSTTGDDKTHIMALLCCLVCICFACLPYLMNCAHNTIYKCSKCHRQVAFKPHDGPVRPTVRTTVPSRYAL